MEPIRLAILGGGNIAFNAHVPAIESVPEVRVVAAAATPEAHARRVAGRFDLPRYSTDPQEVFDDPEVEAVLITTPPVTHADFTRRAAAAGKHVLCEKPMGRSLAECDAMIEACRRAGTVLQIGEMKRFNAGFRAAKDLLDRGVIGEIFMARFHTSYYAPFTRQLWYATPEISGGGQMMNQMPHEVSVLRWFMGRVVAVTAMSNHPLGPQPEDNAAVTLRFEGEALAVVTVSWMAKHYNLALPCPPEFPFDERLEVLGVDGALTIDSPYSYWNVPIRLGVYTDRDVPGVNRGWNFIPCPPGDQYTAQMRGFARAVRGLEPCGYPGPEGRADIAVIRAAMEAAETGRTVAPAL
jgi:predicted dehydrogenase